MSSSGGIAAAATSVPRRAVALPRHAAAECMNQATRGRGGEQNACIPPPPPPPPPDVDKG
ncbi:MAG: hypothetical protein GY862_03635 [Gammaproteobacteria bacterium]|nr:hypothetical protein [Gammaproteobacteria bacterium]